jgi:hypothetical protein
MQENNTTIGILYICTGNYVMFWRDFYLSMEKYFLPDCEKHYFVFTDSSEIDFEKENANIHRLYQPDLGWPDNTLKRFHIFLKQELIISEMNYLFFCNANLLVQKIISAEEFLPSENQTLVAVQHPGFFDKKRNKFTYETNTDSTAHVPYDQGRWYVAGGLNGGKTKIFIEAMNVMKNNIDRDTKHGIVAKWHDESHWNRYVIDRIDVKILSPEFLYPEGWNIPFAPKILIRDKQKFGGHAFLRKQKETLCYTLKKIIKKFI